MVPFSSKSSILGRHFYITRNHESQYSDAQVLYETCSHMGSYHRTCMVGIGYAFLKRYSKEELQKNPELRGEDVKAMEKSFERYSRYPVSIFSFAEGTRFSEQKKITQSSHYENLLNPKSGGIGLTLTTMPYIKLLLDFSIYYESNRRSFWDFLCGRMSNVKVKVREIEIPENLLGKTYENDTVFREELKEWLENIWLEKDNYLKELSR